MARFDTPLTGRIDEGTVWSGGRQRLVHPYAEQVTNLGIAGIGAAAVIAAGRLPFGNSNLFSRVYMPAIRAAEEYSPGRILRTFRASYLLSRFEDAATATRFIPAAELDRLATASSPFIQQLTELTGRRFGLWETRSRGLTFRRGQLFLGQGSNAELLLRHAAVFRDPLGTGANAQSLSYALGLDFGAAINPKATNVSFINAAGKEITEQFHFLGGQTRRQSIGRQVSHIGGILTERVNRLLTSFPDIIPGLHFGEYLRRKGIPGFLTHMGVRPGTPLSTAARLTTKIIGVTAAAYFGYGSLDYVSEQIIGKGPTEIAADLYVQGRLSTARISEATGLQALAARQEDIAPGSTSLLKLGAFPVMGGLAGLGLGYLDRVFQQGILGVDREIISTFGAAHPEWFNKLGQRIRDSRVLSKFIKTPSGLLAAMGALAGTALIAPFIPGALIPQIKEDELRAIYSGQKEVPIRKGRWWEFGRTPWEGQRIQHYRPHAYALMKAGARDVSLHGGPVSPINKFIKGNLTYEFERETYDERPYPITGAAFEDVPVIGPILAATIGRIIKPPKLMHTEEWLATGPSAGQSMDTIATINENTQYKHLPPGFGRVRLTELGEELPGKPMSPTGLRATFSEQVYRLTEMLGLPGFVFESTKEKITGEGQFFIQEQRLETARRAYGAERDVWDRNLGGGFGIGEVLRRLFPHRQRAVPLYNPIRNLMPRWLPGPGQRSPDFLHGDPFTKVPMGEIRLPGRGYATLHPEVEGLSPKDYPLIHRFKILADIAPYSDVYRAMRGKVTGLRKAGALSDQDAAIYDQTMEQIQARRERRTFDEYRYESMESLKNYNNELVLKGASRVGMFGAMVGRYWELLAHKAETPLEYLTPLAPAAKMIHMRTPIEDYEKTQLYGGEMAFWQRPWEHFIMPFIRSTVAMMGKKDIPASVQQVREVEDYYDRLKYIKYTALKNAALREHNVGLISKYEGKRRETAFGVNPYTFNFTHIYRSMPRRERDYFKSFADETDPARRARILNIVPEAQRPLYIARWSALRADQLREQIKGDKLAGDELDKATNELTMIQEDMHNEGMPTSDNLREEYWKTRMQGESYADWYRRTYLLQEEFQGERLPGPNWVGWHPGVDLNSIKLKMVENLGRDIHDFDLWPSDQQAIARQPFINMEAVQETSPENPTPPHLIRERIQEILSTMSMDGAHISIAMYPSDKAEYNVNLEIAQDRTDDIMHILERGI